MQVLAGPVGRRAAGDTLYVRTDPATAEFIRTQARLTGLSISQVVTQVIADWRESHEERLK